MLERLPKVRGQYRQNFKLANVTWFNVGGTADVLFKPEDYEDLQYFLQNKPDDIDVTILGVGSNLLVRDGGIRGVVIKLGRNFTQISHSGNELCAGAGALDINVSLYCAENSLAGLEFLSGIPGVVGAAVAMNAGAYGGDVSEHLSKVEALSYNGLNLTFTNEDLGFKYRGNSLKQPVIFTKAFFKVLPGEKADIIQKINHIKNQRESSQPIKNKTGGSTFKNPSNHKAWQLIDAAGCRGLSLGDAVVSQQHCNFLINQGNATAEDIENLGELVRKRVYEHSGILLEWEIKIIGKKLTK
jgi:UDP-N-acetylmuramate dehydrogenase